MTNSPKCFLHTQEEHTFAFELLLNTNQGGQLLDPVLLETAATICVEIMHGTEQVWFAIKYDTS